MTQQFWVATKKEEKESVMIRKYAVVQTFE